MAMSSNVYRHGEANWAVYRLERMTPPPPLAPMMKAIPVYESER